MSFAFSKACHRLHLKTRNSRLLQTLISSIYQNDLLPLKVTVDVIKHVVFILAEKVVAH